MSSSRSASRLTGFRAEASARVLRLHPLEKALVIILSVHAVFVPWALGTMHPWSQGTSFGLAVFGFFLALWPRNYTEEYAREGRFRLLMWTKLLRSPVFWIGLLIVGYVVIQALNPAWVYMTKNKLWWMRRLDNIEWLPAGVVAPFEQMNPWRMAMFYASAWLVLCAVGVGLTRRASVLTVFGVIVANGAALAMVGILQKLTGAKEVLWSIPVSASYFVATIIYKNHAGAFFNLIVAAGLSLAWWYYSRAERRLAKSSSAPVWGLGAIAAVMVVLVSNSRTSMLLLIGYLVVALIGVGLARWRGRSGTGNPIVMGVVTLAMAAFILLAGKFLGVDKNVDRFQRLFKQDQAVSVEARILARDATWDLAQKNLWLGTGASSFRYLFTPEQLKYPLLDKMGRWRHAHNDYVEWLMEFGVIGSALLLLGIGAWVVRLVRNGAWLQPAPLLLLIGLSLTLAHCWVDFQSHSGAVLITWCLLAAGVTKWTEFGAERSGR